MARKTIYISGPISNDSDFQEHFKKAEADIYENVTNGDWNYTGAINPAKVNSNLPADFEWQDYMECCYRFLDLCHAIYMLSGWQESEGAKRELAYAKLLGLEVYYEDGDN